MSGAVLVAVAAAIGNLLQGWDNATIAGAVLYIKREFKLESEPTIEGLIVAMSLIGATCITTCSGGISDWLGRRPMLIISSILYFLSGLAMLWSPNVYILLLARLLDGFGVGLAVTLVPVYISETAPPEIRGLLNTLPQFTGSIGMFLSYCMVFGMSLMTLPNWRLMLGVLSIPSLVYFALTVFFLPESPRWLVSKGRMNEAKKVLQRLRGREDVSGEMALLVEGLGVGGETSIEEYIIGPANEDIEDHDISADKDRIKLYGPEEGLSWVARPVTGQSTLGLVSWHGSIANQSALGLVDPLVTLFGSVHEKLPETGSMRSALFPHFGSMFSVGGNQARNEEWDEESVVREGEDYQSDGAGGDSDDNLQSPLISRQTTSVERDIVPTAHGSLTSLRNGSLMQANTGDPVGSMGIGGGWQLAWKWSEKEGQDGKKEGGFKRIYLHQEGIPGSRRGSLVSLPGADAPADSDYVQAAALVSQPALYSKELMKQHPVGPAMVHPAETAKGPSWNDLFEPGVKHALVVGVGIQILQQFSGINGVLYYTPQILEQAGVGVLLSNLGVSSSSASLLISGLTTLLMLPSIAVAMRLMDIAGRRSLLLTTIPVLILSLLVLVTGSVVKMGNVVHAAISTVSVVLYFCFFVMGFGPIPNILCAEIFPTRVRGICIAICALTFWICDIIVTYSLPVLLKSVGLAGVFGMYAVVCVISLVFVFLKVPETKGMPLEVITEFFSVGAKQVAAAKNN
ncbi:monosaccharide-sensing protein 2-like isoform X1 [Durio zibethinus]|uniref:Monosaccharide-sensing protein 2-like isoform X1 n=1 Tax=Durio zibethinus TaxID=66656 RepID=A0A6P6AG79_DURZI|nr:monosaccharide-sensing protein 2-like isoform X1 [Durio zibethinus]XP_022763800.1 monosaccharide-sensing protein 2-like isoform X1 [Durio zibethinus]XP_022763801.1 monosaccharide-sensing protein 2-like isoform X1 [Durio zibethinus]XP_022763802.1 monosaccharide-sensing protein 2-like isoform X1 [Durio zibethinus]XP_022763803.1 monosaccharide-sensing protein 2-like isoform X1 [Durio zibethinus]